MIFRLSVESVIIRINQEQQEILLLKKTTDSNETPSVWCLPGRIVNAYEITSVAAISETYVKTKLMVGIIKLLAEQAFEVQENNEKQHRNMFTYLTIPNEENAEIKLGPEYTNYKWIKRDDLESEEFSSLMPRLKGLIEKAFNLFQDNSNAN